MELTWIEDFLALSRTQSFSEAANQRCSTQSAFSRRVQQLEEWLGTTLFERGERPIKLTRAGEDFLRRAQRIREDMMDARRIAMSSKSHYLHAERIYATTAIAVGIIPRWLEKEGPLNQSILTSSTGGCLDALKQKRADKIFLPWFSGDEKDLRLCYEKIGEDDLIPVESKKAQGSVTLKRNLLSGPVLMYAPGTIFGQQISARLLALGLICRSTQNCESSSAEALLELVKRGLGAAWIPRSLIEPGVSRCAVPATLDIPCSIMLVTRNAGRK